MVEKPNPQNRLALAGEARSLATRLPCRQNPWPSNPYVPAERRHLANAVWRMRNWDIRDYLVFAMGVGTAIAIVSMVVGAR